MARMLATVFAGMLCISLAAAGAAGAGAAAEFTADVSAKVRPPH